jgi:ankyrin repeat protein
MSTSVTDAQIFDAVRNGNKPALDELLSGSPSLDIRDPEGKSPLHRAVEGGHTSIVQALLLSRYTIYLLDDQNRTPIYYAIINNNTDILKVFIKNKIDLEEGCDANDATPLQVAIKCKFGDIVKILISEGADFLYAVQMAVEVGWGEGPELICQAGNEALESAIGRLDGYE